MPKGLRLYQYGGYHRIFRTPFSDRAEMNPQSPAGCVLMLVVPALLVVSTYLAWWELRFLVQGQTADAVVNGVEAIKLTRHRMFVGPYLEIRYSFHDERSGELRTEHDELPLDWPRPVGTVRIEYVPGLPGGSRVEGHRHAWFTILFVVCLIGSGVYVGFLLRDARRAVSEEEAFEARRRRRHED